MNLSDTIPPKLRKLNRERNRTGGYKASNHKNEQIHVRRLVMKNKAFSVSDFRTHLGC